MADAAAADAFDEAAATKKAKKMNNDRLKAALERAGADTDGMKPVLVERLVAAQRAAAGGAAPPKPSKKPAAKPVSKKPASKKPAAAAPMDVDEAADPEAFDEAAVTKKVKRMKVEDLRAALEAVGAVTEGAKLALVERLVAAKRASSSGEAMEEADAPAPAAASSRSEAMEEADAPAPAAASSRSEAMEEADAPAPAAASLRSEAMEEADAPAPAAASSRSEAMDEDDEDDAPAPAPAAAATEAEAPAPGPARQPHRRDPEETYPEDETDPQKMRQLLALMSPLQEDRFEQARRARFKPGDIKKLEARSRARAPGGADDSTKEAPLDGGAAIVLASLAKSHVAELVRTARLSRPGEGALRPSDYAAAARALQRHQRRPAVGSHKRPRLGGPAVIDADELL